MSDRTLRASLYFLGAVTVLYLLVTVLRNGDGGGGPADDSGLAAVLAELDGEWLTRADLAGPDETIELSKDGGIWTVNGFDADSAAGRALPARRGRGRGQVGGGHQPGQPRTHGGRRRERLDHDH